MAPEKAPTHKKLILTLSKIPKRFLQNLTHTSFFHQHPSARPNPKGESHAAPKSRSCGSKAGVAHRATPVAPKTDTRGGPPSAITPITCDLLKGRKPCRAIEPLQRLGGGRRAEEPPQATRRRTYLTQRCTRFTFLNPLLYPVISTLAQPTICGSACASIRPTSMLMRRVPSLEA